MDGSVNGFSYAPAAPFFYLLLIGPLFPAAELFAALVVWGLGANETLPYLYKK